MNPVLCGLAANAALPSALVDRLTAVADVGIAADLAHRADLSHAQALELASRVEESAVWLAYAGRLTVADVDPVAQPRVALALLDEGAGSPEWARLLAAGPVAECREKLAACSALPPDVVEKLAADSDVRVVAELALWTTPEVAARLAGHPHAEVRRAVAANEATPPAVLASLLTGEGLPPARRCLGCVTSLGSHLEVLPGVTSRGSARSMSASFDVTGSPWKGTRGVFVASEGGRGPGLLLPWFSDEYDTGRTAYPTRAC